MAGSTFQPPISLDPNQDPSQQTAFINQNFQSLASSLETNSFRVVETGTGTIPATTLSAPGSGSWGYQSGTNTVAHGLDFIPAIMPFLTLGGQYYPLPFTNLGLGSGPNWEVYYVTVDATNIYFSVDIVALTGGVTTNNQTVKYYLLQQSAS